MSTPTELRVFISSTFRDLQEEREHLVKKIFPEIRALCRERGVTFTEVDLRWGLTEEQATLGTVIRTCLEEVDKCRPYFIGMLGSRYGWAPDLHEVLIDPELVAKYPWVEEAAIDGMSLTEMEFVHGVFNEARDTGHYSYFYHRPRQTGETDYPEKLEALIQRVRQGGYPLREFSDVEQLGSLVHDDLLAMIKQYWPEQEAPSALELERRAHAAFSASRRRAYIPNPQTLKEFNEWVARSSVPLEQGRRDADPTLIVSGDSGLGKSSLVAYLVEHYRKKNPTALVIEHYVGASEQSGSALSLARHVISEIRELFAIADALPTDPQKLLADFPNWLWRLGDLAKAREQEVLIVLDALNQLDEAGQRLTWLPPAVPENLKLLVSATPGDALDALRGRAWRELELAPIEDERVRQSIVLRYLGEFHKGISPEQLRPITSNRKGNSPLYLRVVAEELRLHGDHESLTEMIKRYVSAEDLDEVFQQVLDRMEQDYGVESVREVLSLIWCSRSGLSETELLELTGMSRLELSRLLFAFDYHLLHRDGLLGFFHDYLRRAVLKRYLADQDSRQSAHRKIAQYFQTNVADSISASGVAPLRMSEELAYQLHTVHDLDRLAVCLTTIPVFLSLYQGETQYLVLAYWSAIGGLRDVEQGYRDGLDRWETTDEAKRCVALGHIASMLHRLGRWNGAIDLQRQLLGIAITCGDRTAEAAARMALGRLKHARGQDSEAYAEYQKALDICTKLGDRRGIAAAIGNMGIIHFRQGEHDLALDNYRKALDICTELGDRPGIATTCAAMGALFYHSGEVDSALESFQRQIGICEELGDRTGIRQASANIGVIHAGRGDYDLALETFRRQLNMCEELGDRPGIASLIGNIGEVYATFGDIDLALESYERQLSICEELEDRRGVAEAESRIGRLCADRGEHDRALEHFSRQVSICEGIGDRRGLFAALGTMGRSYAHLGEFQRSLENYHRAVEGHDAIGFRHGLPTWHTGIAEVLLEIVDLTESMPEYLPNFISDISEDRWRSTVLQRARAHAEQCVAISDELSKPHTLFDGRFLLARIDIAEGARDHAIQTLLALLNELAPLDVSGGEFSAEHALQRAQLHYSLWKLNATDADHRAEALRLYQALTEKTSSNEYRTLIEELDRR